MSKNWRICTKTMTFMPFFLVNLNKSFLVNHLTLFQLYLQKTEEKIEQVLTENHLLLFFLKTISPEMCKKSLSNISWEISRKKYNKTVFQSQWSRKYEWGKVDVIFLTMIFSFWSAKGISKLNFIINPSWIPEQAFCPLSDSEAI